MRLIFRLCPASGKAMKRAGAPDVSSGFPQCAVFLEMRPASYSVYSSVYGAQGAEKRS